MPYLSVTQSGVLPAAMTFGKAVVASSVGALTQVVMDEQTGLLVPPPGSRGRWLMPLSGC